MPFDWTNCAAVERVPGKLSGAPVIRGTRVRPEDILINRAEGIPWLVENFGVPTETIQVILAFHDHHRKVRVPHPAG